MVNNRAELIGDLRLSIITVVLALMCCGGAGACGAFLYITDQREKPGARAGTEAYLNAVVRGDYDTAYDLLCESDRRRFPRAEWEPVRDRRTPPTGFRIVHLGSRDPETPGHRDVTVEISHAGGPATEVEIHVDKEGDVWRACGPPRL